MSGGVGTPMLENSVPSGVSMSQQPAEVRLRTVRRGMGRGPLESRHDEPAPEAAPPGLDWIDAQPWVGPSGEGWLQDDSSHDTTPMLENAVAEAEVQMAHEVTHESLPLPEDYEDRAEPAADSRDPVASMLRSIDEGGGQPGPRNHERSRSRSRRVPRQPTVPPPLVPRQPTVPPPLHMARQETTGEKQSRWERENEAFFDQPDSDWKEDDVDVLSPRRRRHRRGSRHHRRHHRGTSCSVSPPRRRRSTGRRGSRHNRGECQTQTQRHRSPAHDDADDVEEKGPDGRTIWSRATASMVELMERPSPPRPEGQQSPEAAEAAVAGPQVADGGDTDATWRHRRRRSELSARARSRPRPSQQEQAGKAAEAPARALRPARDFGLSHQVTHFRSVLRPQPPSVPPPEPAAEAPASELSAPARSVPPPPPSVPPPPCMAPAAAAENALPGWSCEEVEVHRPPASAPARSVLRPQPPNVPPPCVAPASPPLSAQARSLLLSPVPTTRRASGEIGRASCRERV